MVPVRDADAEPFSGPFSFYLEKDEILNQRWKLEPAHGWSKTQHFEILSDLKKSNRHWILLFLYKTGEMCGLVSRKTLAYGNYSVPLVIEDKQNLIGHQTLEVILCDCDHGDVCRKELPLSTNVSGAGIGLIIAGLLLFLCEYEDC